MTTSDSVVFLGGTCNDDPWREEVMKGLDERGVPYFNPVVADWNEEAQKREEEIKAKPDTIQLFVITSKMTGVFSIAEVVASACEDPWRTVLGICMEGFDEGQRKSLWAVERLVQSKGAMTVMGTTENSRSKVLGRTAEFAAEAWKKQQSQIIRKGLA